MTAENTTDAAGVSLFEREVGRMEPKRYEDGRIKGGCSLRDAEQPNRCCPYHHRCPEPRCVDCCGVVDEHDILECPHCGKQWTAPCSFNEDYS